MSAEEVFLRGDALVVQQLELAEQEPKLTKSQLRGLRSMIGAIAGQERARKKMGLPPRPTFHDGRPWPTVAQMKERLRVLDERHDGGATRTRTPSKEPSKP